MRSLSDGIEDYIKRLISLNPGQVVDIQRSELAVKFSCVPSQINYVLSTRFTPERGYLVDSKRGGGGYIRINRVKPLSKTWESFFKAEGLDLRQARDIIKRLFDEKNITRRESEIIEAALKDEVFKGLTVSGRQQSVLIKRIFYNMVITVLRQEE